MQIIKLTGLSGRPVYVALAHIVLFERDHVEAEGRNSRVITTAERFYVKERPSEILALISNAKEI